MCRGGFYMRAYNEKNSKVICKNLGIADSFFDRLKGLMFREKLNKGEGLLIIPCNSIHTFFMKFPIDVLFVNKEDKIVASIEKMKPSRISKIYGKAKYVVELPAGTIEKCDISVGDRIIYEK